ncbi:MAG: hypothetical protein KF764_34905 [Labilithrix sp.]|nr:hypothetical protein [Labilithrix sp.]MBX3222132.1 hypothetical protein [Labilithrix sp.]
MRTHEGESTGDGRRSGAARGALDRPEASRRPQGLAVRAVAGLFVLGAVASACAGEDEKEVLPPVVLGMLETTAPTYDDGQQQIYQVGREVRLPYRRPTDEERPRGEQDPYPRPPFHITADSRVTVRYTLSNLDDRQHTVELLIDPWNEFVRYVPGVTTVRDEEVLPNFSGIDRFVILPPKGRVEGIITPDDMRELATDLTIAMALARRPPDAMGAFGGAALYNRTFNIQNRSSQPDPVLQDWMPASTTNLAAVIGFDVGLRTYAQAKVAVELVIDIEDLNGERVVMDGEEARHVGRPGEVLTPPAGAGPM